MPRPTDLPDKLNPLLQPKNTPQYGLLLERRRLGQTRLTVKPGQVGTSNATKPENLGVFDYAHLRAPLPRDLKGSEIFPVSQNIPESYFLMRRSSDGYISATGMFKAAFPWAMQAEEEAERDYVKSLPTTSQDEIAGNVWIAPESALKLAQEYGIETWIRALLDPEPISNSADKKTISSPPKFSRPSPDSALDLPPPSANRGSTPTMAARRGRPRGSSPMKSSPRKPRQTKAMREANLRATQAANEALQSALDNAAASVADSESVISDFFKEEAEPSKEQLEGKPKEKKSSKRGRKAKSKVIAKVEEEEHSEAEATQVPPEAIETTETIETTEVTEATEVVKGQDEVEDEEPEKVAKVTVAVDSSVDLRTETETETTQVTIEVPDSAPNMPTPEDTKAMIEEAKRMVEEARALEAEKQPENKPEVPVVDGEPASETSKGRKRKVEEISKGEEDEVEDVDAELPAQPVKKARVLEERLKRERVRNRALIGVAFTFAVG
ncbi:MAG: hypothetical protein M1834_001616 [Cirrosporium novae-zelandiae]|nr:MAG: hypothetical protein M1834_004133 [Cirrosporium novae-zelandiae]KAI9735600.1 MAG: hypothetical protein M1834_001616 [Cirrosporium novae-zelandiae]